MKIDAQAILNAYPDHYSKEDLQTFMRASYITEEQMYNRIDEYDKTKPKLDPEFILAHYPSTYDDSDLDLFYKRGYLTKKQVQQAKEGEL